MAEEVVALQNYKLDHVLCTLYSAPVQCSCTEHSLSTAVPINMNKMFDNNNMTLFILIIINYIYTFELCSVCVHCTVQKLYPTPTVVPVCNFILFYC